MAIPTYGIYLMKKTESTYTKLIDIKDFPDLGGAPELLETTTLSDKAQTYINGIQSMSALEFTCNYDKADYTMLKALEGKQDSYAIWFGKTTTTGTDTPDGSDGKFEVTGDLAVWAVGGGVNAVVDMKISIAPSTVITMGV